MNPKRAVAILMGTTFVLLIPLVVFLLYLAQRFPAGHWPLWSTYLILIWFVGIFVVGMLLFSKLMRRAAREPQSVSTGPVKSKVGLWIIRIWFTPLVVWWSILFVRGVKEDIQGKYPLDRAIPADAFLLIFIVVFGWVVYRAWKTKPSG